MTAALPQPAADARAHSERLVERVREAIVAAGGFLPFADYMQLALYAPALGYYAAGATKLGRAGDFTTAPEMTPLFATALAAQLDPILAASGRREVLELGAGSGRLAADLLAALAARDAAPGRYRILEPSPDLRERQRETIARDAPEQVERVHWIDALPASIDGALVANEVLDAIPVHVVARRGGDWFERGVGWNATSRRLQWAERPLGAGPLRALAGRRFPAEGDYASELNPAAEALVEQLARRFVRGAAIIVDYGFPASEYYHPQRSEGTLMGHYRHRAHSDPFLWPGLSDLTAHVDFTAIAAAGERGGMDIAGFTSQAAFLMGCGILDALSAIGDPSSIGYIKAAAAVQKLLSPAEMGELFKVLALSRGIDVEWPGFALADRGQTLFGTGSDPE